MDFGIKLTHQVGGNHTSYSMLSPLLKENLKKLLHLRDCNEKDELQVWKCFGENIKCMYSL